MFSCQAWLPWVWIVPSLSKWWTDWRPMETSKRCRGRAWGRSKAADGLGQETICSKQTSRLAVQG